MRNRQRGVALLIIALILSLATVGFFISRFSARNIEQEQAAETTASLAEAKAALLGFAASFQSSETGRAGRYGFLPCPEIELTFGFEGSASSPCGVTYANSIGRLPWRSLRSAPLQDGTKECLWYAVSGSYKNSGTSTPEMLNADTPGQFEILGQDGIRLAGTSPENRAVAVIFSVGSVVGGQNRTPSPSTSSCPGNYTAADYLETLDDVNNAFVNASRDRVDRFIVGNGNSRFNDRMVFITQAEIFGKLTTRKDFLGKMEMLSEKIATCLANFARNPSDLPWAAPMSLADYRVNKNYQSNSSLNPKLARGRVPYQQVSSSTSPPTEIIKIDTINPPVCGGLTASDLALWKNWKDHFFYVRATDLTCSVPGSCLTVNRSNTNYISIVFFAGGKLGTQTRLAPPLDSDSKMTIANYLEGRNRTNFEAGGNFEKSPSDATFNDILYCISPNFSVSNCETPS